ncbi:MAG: HNH endonuclease signature motif containing protein [Pseudomonadota bacterium]
MGGPRRILSQPFKLAPSKIVDQLWQAQAGLCALCGEPMLRSRFQAPHAQVWAKQRATVDHIVPKSKGGADTAENLQLAHARCNKIKGNCLWLF